MLQKLFLTQDFKQMREFTMSGGVRPFYLLMVYLLMLLVLQIMQHQMLE
jgi:hypothetical protein